MQELKIVFIVAVMGVLISSLAGDVIEGLQPPKQYWRESEEWVSHQKESVKVELFAQSDLEASQSEGN